MEERNRLTTIEPRFIRGTKNALCSELLAEGPTPICFCKPFSCKACLGIGKQVPKVGACLIKTSNPNMVVNRKQVSGHLLANLARTFQRSFATRISNLLKTKGVLPQGRHANTKYCCYIRTGFSKMSTFSPLDDERTESRKVSGDRLALAIYPALNAMVDCSECWSTQLAIILNVPRGSCCPRIPLHSLL